MAEEVRSAGDKESAGPGPYMAIVRNHLDTEYMGTLEVELLKSSTEGNTTDVTGEMATVSYLSPFYGVTPYEGTSDNDGFDYTQKSYGMWAVPPDVGTTVLVIFVEGNKSRGFWIGCVQEKFMNFMIPGNASTKYNKEDQSVITPVGEYNKRNETADGNDPTQFLKPVNTDAVTQLTDAGLITDQIRGTTTSSARREVPSMVFGMSTPGPLDRRPGKPNVKVGAETAQTEQPASRLTGSTFVMDDGDSSMFRIGPAATDPSEYVKLEDDGDPTLPMNELVRIRTRTGHQILLHNTEDLIYISHSSGQSWIEMTAGGKIDIYSKDSISIHTKQDFNFFADRDINMEAGRNFNLKVAERHQTEVGDNLNLLVAGNKSVAINGDMGITVSGGNKITTAGNFDLSTGGNNKLTAGGSTDIKSGGNHTETASQIHMNGPGAAAAEAATPPEELLTFANPDGTEGTIDSIMLRIPSHEPWPHHENLDPLSFKPEMTDREAGSAIAIPESVPVADTFTKGTTATTTTAPPPATTPTTANVTSTPSRVGSISANDGNAGEAEAQAFLAAQNQSGSANDGNAGEAEARAFLTSTKSRIGADTADPGFIGPQ
jgi:hypothetical protein